MAQQLPAPFLTKTYQLVDDSSTDHIVSWGDDRISTFVVWRPPEFARDLLPNYFKHNNFSSFVRQLNTYGFRKVVPERWEFANEFFRKGEKHLLCEIHRRKTSAAAIAAAGSLQLPHYSHLFHHPFEDYYSAPPTGKHLLLFRNDGEPTAGASAAEAALVEENERLRRSNEALISELAHMRRLYNDIIYFVQNHVRPVVPSSVSGYNGRNGSFFQLHQPAAGGMNSGGSATSSSSLTIAEEPSAIPDRKERESSGGGGSPTRLFGVTLNAKRREYPIEPGFNHSTKPPHLALNQQNLPLNQISSSPSM